MVAALAAVPDFAMVGLRARDLQMPVIRGCPECRVQQTQAPKSTDTFASTFHSDIFSTRPPPSYQGGPSCAAQFSTRRRCRGIRREASASRLNRRPGLPFVISAHHAWSSGIHDYWRAVVVHTILHSSELR